MPFYGKNAKNNIFLVFFLARFKKKQYFCTLFRTNTIGIHTNIRLVNRREGSTRHPIRQQRTSLGEPPPKKGKLSEWSKEPHSKCGVRITSYRGFESLTFRRVKETGTPTRGVPVSFILRGGPSQHTVGGFFSHYVRTIIVIQRFTLCLIRLAASVK